MEINIENITNGSFDNAIVWVCDLRSGNKELSKPIRHVRPTKVLVRSNDKCKQKIYYSKSHFIELNKQDKPIKSKIHKPYDSTGFRSYTGVPLKVFDNKIECQEEYEKMFNNFCVEIEKSINKIKEKFENFKETKTW